MFKKIIPLLESRKQILKAEKERKIARNNFLKIIANIKQKTRKEILLSYKEYSEKERLLLNLHLKKHGIKELK